MTTTVRATCPKCRTALRIPTAWIGQPIRCKICSAVVRSTPRRDDDTPRPVALDQTVPINSFDFSEPPVVVAALPLDPTGPPVVPAHPISETNEFETGSDLSPRTRSRRYRGGKRSSKLLPVVLLLLVAGGAVFGGMSLVKYLDQQYEQPNAPLSPTKFVEQLGSSDPAVRDSAMKALREMGSKAETALRSGAKSENREVAKRCEELLIALAPAASGNPTTIARNGPFPRRMLFISITRYMYLNPLTATLRGADQSLPAASHLAYQWRIPNDKDNNQLFILSDTTKPAPSVPLKPIVVGAFERFFETSRDQDRIVIYFGGHVVEKDGRAYLAPIEGELEDANTLIPLAEFYSKLNACPASQKVVIWDVCRFNPVRGHERPGSTAMTETLAKSLATAPPGVEVIVTCRPGENAMEFERIAITPPFAGSVFLGALKSLKPQTGAKAPTQADPIPVAEWSQAVAKRVTELTATGTSAVKQTVKATGVPRADAVAYNPDVPPAKPFDMPVSPKGTARIDITQIASEFQVPPIKSGLAELNLADVVYLESVMKDYQADVPAEDALKDRERYKLRAAVLDAFETVREVWAGDPAAGGTGKLPEEIKAPITDAIKREINKGLDFYALGIAKLDLSNIALDEVERLRAGETRRWQAHYDYARAVVKSRLAYLNEYNKLMGDVRTETMPALEKGQNLYKLASSEKMKSKKDIQLLVDQAQEAYGKLVTEHKGTPWAIQAKREKNFSLGLVWQPSSTLKEPDAK